LILLLAGFVFLHTEYVLRHIGFNLPRIGFSTPRAGFNTPRTEFSTPRAESNTPLIGFVLRLAQMSKSLRQLAFPVNELAECEKLVANGRN
jgi:hypothetical protein